MKNRSGFLRCYALYIGFITEGAAIFTVHNEMRVFVLLERIGLVFNMIILSLCSVATCNSIKLLYCCLSAFHLPLSVYLEHLRTLDFTQAFKCKISYGINLSPLAVCFLDSEIGVSLWIKWNTKMLLHSYVAFLNTPNQWFHSKGSASGRQ